MTQNQERPLLMIPGPIEVSSGVLRALAVPPPGHTSPPLIEAFGEALERMRRVWRADAASQPIVVGGGGTLAMEMAAANLVSPGDRALVVKTGYFSDRMAEILRRHGAEVVEVGAEPGDAPTPGAVDEALAAAAAAGSPCKTLFATHVDTSTGVRLDPQPLARLARQHDMLSVFDGVCGAAGERFDMAEWDADLYFTGSQKALGLPPGLALMVASPRAMAASAARTGRTAAPPLMYLDWQVWQPILRAYEERRAAYFSTPPTNLILALRAGLAEIEDEGIAARVQRHAAIAAALRAAWRALGLRLLPVRDQLAANTMSALLLGQAAAGVDTATLVAAIARQGVIVTGGLLPAIRTRYFRVGHMGWVTTRPDLLRRTVTAVAAALADLKLGAGPAAEAHALEALSEVGAAR